jgi:hypothetical protein
VRGTSRLFFCAYAPVARRKAAARTERAFLKLAQPTSIRLARGRRRPSFTTAFNSHAEAKAADRSAHGGSRHRTRRCHEAQERQPFHPLRTIGLFCSIPRKRLIPRVRNPRMATDSLPTSLSNKIAGPTVARSLREPTKTMRVDAWRALHSLAISALRWQLFRRLTGRYTFDVQALDRRADLAPRPLPGI